MVIVSAIYNTCDVFLHFLLQYEARNWICVIAVCTGCAKGKLMMRVTVWVSQLLSECQYNCGSEGLCKIYC